jgi:hypothetical protein
MHIRVFYDSQQRMIAGYAINNKPPYKTLSYVPDDVCLNGIRVTSSNEIVFSEVIALWIKASASNTIRASVYCMSVIDSALLKPDFILGGCSLRGARRTQMRALPKLLWHGTGKPFDKVVHNWVFYATPLQAVLRLPYAVVMGWVDRLPKIHRIAKRFLRRAKV